MASAHLYNIILQNNTGNRQNYVFCCAPPEASGADVQTIAWINADVAQNGTYTVSTSDQVFAWTGTCPNGQRQGTVVRNGSVTPVQLGSNNVRGTTAHMTVGRNDPEFGASTMRAREGCFEIDTDNSFTGNDECLIGMAKVGAHGLVCPVAVTRAMPARTTSLAPRMKLYLCQMQCQPGEILNMESMFECAVVDFTTGNGRDRNTAVVQHDERGEYRIMYYNYLEAADVMQAVRDGQLRNHPQRRYGSNDDKLRELTLLTSTLTRLLSSMDLGPAEREVAMRWLGRVNWPTATSITTASAGANMISQDLTSRGYGVTCRTSTNSDGTKTAEFTVSRSGSGGLVHLMASDPESDWLAALKADTQSDGHTNGGFNPAPGLDRMAMTKAQKRMSLQQFRDVLNNGFLGQHQQQNDQKNMGYGNGRSNEYSGNQGNGNSHEYGERYSNGINNGMSNGMGNGMYSGMMNGMNHGLNGVNGHNHISERSNGVY